MRAGYCVRLASMPLLTEVSMPFRIWLKSNRAVRDSHALIASNITSVPQFQPISRTSISEPRHLILITTSVCPG